MKLEIDLQPHAPHIPVGYWKSGVGLIAIPDLHTSYVNCHFQIERADSLYIWVIHNDGANSTFPYIAFRHVHPMAKIHKRSAKFYNISCNPLGAFT